MPEWKYLESKAFKSRYVLAAWLVQDCPNVFEIGGYKTPIDQFLNANHHEIWSIDPRITLEDSWAFESGSSNIFRRKKRWPDLEFPEVEPKTYALVVLGLELTLKPKEWEKFYALVRGSKRTVLGVVPDHIHSQNQYEKIVEVTGARKTMDITLDLSQNDFGDMTDSAPPKTTRRIVVLEC